MNVVQRRHKAIATALLGVALSSAASAATIGTWNVDGAGNWNNAANWSGGIPLVTGDEARLTYNITTATTVTIDTPVVLSTLKIGDSGGTVLNYALSLGIGQTLTLNGNGSAAVLQQTAGSNTLPAMVLASDVEVSALQAGSNYFRLAGTISGTGNLIFPSTNIGQPYITGTNTFVGNMTLNGGTVMVNGNGVFGSTSNGTRVITLNNNSTLRLNANITLGANRQLAIGTTGGKIEFNAKTLTLGYAGQLTGSTPLTLTSSGAGAILAVDAAQSSYTGAISIGSNITMRMGPSGSIAASSVSVPAGATLGGSGTISGAVNVTGGTLAPGNSAGTLTAGALTMGSATVLSYELNATDHTEGGGINDEIVVNGNLTLDGTINLAALTELTAGSYTLIHYTGTLTDNGLNIGSNFGVANNQQYAIVNDGANGDINLIVTVPEPAALGLVGTGLLLGFARRRRVA